MRRLSALLLFTALSACAAPAPVAAPQVQGMSYPVFFSPWSAMLGDDALSALQHASDAAKAGSGPVVVTGYADPTGSAEANRRLSRLRAQVVRDQMVLDGVVPARISLDANGATKFAQNSLESRRVDVTVGR